MCKDLSDNLTETPIVKNSNINLKSHGQLFPMTSRRYFYWRIWGGGGGTPGTRSLWVQFLSCSCSFRKKFGQILGWRSDFRGWRTRLGNHGSGTDFPVRPEDMYTIDLLRKSRFHCCYSEDMPERVSLDWGAKQVVVGEYISFLHSLYTANPK